VSRLYDLIVGRAHLFAQRQISLTCCSPDSAPGKRLDERGFSVACWKVGFAYLMTHTISADEVAADLAPEQMLVKTLANLSYDLRAHLEGQGQVR
jgi:hypothetical protein